MPSRSARMPPSRSRPTTTSRPRTAFTATSPPSPRPSICRSCFTTSPAAASWRSSVETMAKLAKIPNIVGVKDATGNLARASRDRDALPESFVRLSGDDATALGFIAHGGVGCISVTSNVAPRASAEFQDACAAGNYAKALAIQDRLMAASRCVVLRGQPGAHQICRLSARPLRRRGPPSDRPDVRQGARDRPGGDGAREARSTPDHGQEEGRRSEDRRRQPQGAPPLLY